MHRFCPFTLLHTAKIFSDREKVEERACRICYHHSFCSDAHHELSFSPTLPTRLLPACITSIYNGRYFCVFSIKLRIFVWVWFSCTDQFNSIRPHFIEIYTTIVRDKFRIMQVVLCVQYIPSVSDLFSKKQS